MFNDSHIMPPSKRVDAGTSDQLAAGSALADFQGFSWAKNNSSSRKTHRKLASRLKDPQDHNAGVINNTEDGGKRKRLLAILNDDATDCQPSTSRLPQRPAQPSSNTLKPKPPTVTRQTMGGNSTPPATNVTPDSRIVANTIGRKGKGRGRGQPLAARGGGVTSVPARTRPVPPPPPGRLIERLALDPPRSTTEVEVSRDISPSPSQKKDTELVLSVPADDNLTSRVSLAQVFDSPANHIQSKTPPTEPSVLGQTTLPSVTPDNSNVLTPPPNVLPTLEVSIILATPNTPMNTPPNHTIDKPHSSPIPMVVQESASISNRVDTSVDTPDVGADASIPIFDGPRSENEATSDFPNLESDSSSVANALVIPSNSLDDPMLSPTPMRREISVSAPQPPPEEVLQGSAQLLREEYNALQRRNQEVQACGIAAQRAAEAFTSQANRWMTAVESFVVRYGAEAHLALPSFSPLASQSNSPAAAKHPELIPAVVNPNPVVVGNADPAPQSTITSDTLITLPGIGHQEDINDFDMINRDHSAPMERSQSPISAHTIDEHFDGQESDKYSGKESASWSRRNIITHRNSPPSARGPELGYEHLYVQQAVSTSTHEQQSSSGTDSWPVKQEDTPDPFQYASILRLDPEEVQLSRETREHHLHLQPPKENREPMQMRNLKNEGQRRFQKENELWHQAEEDQRYAEDKERQAEEDVQGLLEQQRERGERQDMQGERQRHEEYWKQREKAQVDKPRHQRNEAIPVQVQQTRKDMPTVVTAIDPIDPLIAPVISPNANHSGAIPTLQNNGSSGKRTIAISSIPTYRVIEESGNFERTDSCSQVSLGSLSPSEFQLLEGPYSNLTIPRILSPKPSTQDVSHRLDTLNPQKRPLTRDVDSPDVGDEERSAKRPRIHSESIQSSIDLSPNLAEPHHLSNNPATSYMGVPMQISVASADSLQHVELALYHPPGSTMGSPRQHQPSVPLLESPEQVVVDLPPTRASSDTYSLHKIRSTPSSDLERSWAENHRRESSEDSSYSRNQRASTASPSPRDSVQPETIRDMRQRHSPLALDHQGLSSYSPTHEVRHGRYTQDNRRYLDHGVPDSRNSTGYSDWHRERVSYQQPADMYRPGSRDRSQIYRPPVHQSIRRRLAGPTRYDRSRTPPGRPVEYYQPQPVPLMSSPPHRYNDRRYEDNRNQYDRRESCHPPASHDPRRTSSPASTHSSLQLGPYRRYEPPEHPRHSQEQHTRRNDYTPPPPSRVSTVRLNPPNLHRSLSSRIAMNDQPPEKYYT